MDLGPDEQRRVDAYLASQNYFAGVAEDVATRIILDWLARNLPWILSRIRKAAVNAWQAIREWFGF